jgi:hypothetical protein
VCLEFVASRVFLLHNKASVGHSYIA